MRRSRHCERTRAPDRDTSAGIRGGAKDMTQESAIALAGALYVATLLLFLRFFRFQSQCDREIQNALGKRAHRGQSLGPLMRRHHRIHTSQS